MNIFLVEDGSVRGISSNYNVVDITTLRQWKGCKTGRTVIAINKGLPYLLGGTGMWSPLPKKPDVLTMAELVGAIKPITLVEVKSEISSDSFFNKR